MATMIGIASAIGTAVLGILLALVRHYRARASAAEAASQQLEQANAAIERETKDRLGRLEDVDAYHQARARGLSPGEALKAAEGRQ